jgi:tetratricopeptide (TPR) repeat protein
MSDNAHDWIKLWNFQDPAGTRAKFQAVLPETEGENRLEVLTQIARTHGLQEQFDEAHALLDEVEGALSDETRLARLRYLLERGRAFNSGGTPDKARPLFEQAWELGKSIPHHSLAVDAAHMIAIVVPPDEKTAWNEAGMEYAEQSDDEGAARWLGTLYNNMGWNAHEVGDYAKALALHEKCWAWHRERATGRGERVAKWAVAKQLRFLGRGDEAMPMQGELLTEYAADEPGGEGFVHEELAELLHARGDLDGAKPHFARAHELLKQYTWIEEARMQRLHELGKA